MMAENSRANKFSELVANANKQQKEEADLAWRKKLRENPLPSELATEDNKARQDKEMKNALAKGLKFLAPSDLARTAGEQIGKKLLKDYKKGGSVKSSASKRADGCAVKGKTRGKVV